MEDPKMRIAWLNMTEHRLYQSLTHIGQLQVDLIDGYECDCGKYGAVITEDSSIDLDQVRELKTKFPQSKVIHIIRQKNPDDMKQMDLICKSYGIFLLLYSFDNNKTYEEILRILYPERYTPHKGKIVAFLGTHSGVGVTSIIHAVADIIAKKSTARIGVIHLNPWNEGGHARSGKSLDEISTLIKSNNINSDQLFQAFSMKKDFYELRGNRDLTKISRYEPHVIRSLVSMSEEVFDLLLLNLGWAPNHPLFLEGIRAADTYYLVSTQEHKSISAFAETKNQCLQGLKIDPTSFLLVVNKVDPNRSLLPKQVSQQLNIPLLVECASVPSISEDLEKGNKLMSEHRQLEESITIISKGIIENYGLSIKEESLKSKQSRFFQFLGIKTEASKVGGVKSENG